MFRQDFKNNLKDKIICNRRILSNIFNLIEVAINLDNKLYKRAIKKIQSILRKSKNLLRTSNRILTKKNLF